MDEIAHAALARADRALRAAEANRPHLPDPPLTAADFRAYAVWLGALERMWAAHKAAMETIFGELDDDRAAREAIRRGDLDELGRRIKDAIDFRDGALVPILDRLEGALDKLEAQDPADAARPRWLAAYARIRQRLRAAIPEAYLVLAPAASLYRALPEGLREEAERRWGPLTGTDPHDFAPLWRRHMPSERIAAIDRRARALTGGGDAR